jgi:hypothetical protein
MLFVFFKNFGRIGTHNFMQINIITPNYAYYKIVRLALGYKYPTALIFHKTCKIYEKLPFKQVI